MNTKIIKKWIYKHQVESLILLVSLIACIIGNFTVGSKAIVIVAIVDLFVFFGPSLYEKYLKVRNIERRHADMVKGKIAAANNASAVKSNSVAALKSGIKKTIKAHEVRTKPQNKRIKTTKKKWWKIALMVVFIGFIIGMLAMGTFFIYIAIAAPKFDPNELYASEATIIYDNKGDEIAKLGSEKREKITYDELPEVFVDALVATEDSRFFQHNGFDLPRFAKATFGQIIGSSGAGGASTLTMQVSKNAFTSSEDQGIKGIIRKFTDIYLSIFQIEKNYTKQEIIEFYVNNNLLGGNNYGVEQASLAYFGKSAKDMNLSEAALIAGIFKAPNTYNPLINPENAAYRRGVVLSLMVRHGYITEEEADAANAISVEDLIATGSGTGDDTKYQGFVDTVVAEIKEDTGFNPYTTSMEIYTTMDTEKQDAINKIMSGETFNWENDVVQAGITVLDTKTGAVVAVGTNRDSSASGLLNHATFQNQTRRQIGSTAKPLYDYGPAIEYNNATPGQLVADEEYSYSDGTNIQNFDGNYQGVITYRTALAGSRNIPALKVFQSVKKTNIIEFATNLGLSPEVSGNSLHEAHAIGGYNGESPMTVAGAYAAFGNGGTYNEPYSYTKLVYRDSGEEYENEKVSNKAMSEATAYIVQDMLVTTASSALLGYSNVNGWKFSAKTGTSNFSEETKTANGLAGDAINDLWVAAFNDECTISVWYGYDKIYSDHYTHFGNMQHAALFNAVAKSVWTRSTNIKKPDSVVSVAVETQAVEPILPSAYTPDALKSTELFKKGTEPTETSTRFAQLSNVTGLEYESSGGEVTLSWNAATAKWLGRDYLTTYYKKLFSNTGFLSSYVSSIMGWNSSYLGSLGYDIYEEDENGTYVKVGSTTDTSYTFEPSSSGSTTIMVRTAYTNFKSNQATGTTITAKINGTATTYSVSIAPASITKGSTYNYASYVTVSPSSCTTVSEIVIDGGSKHTSWASAISDIKTLDVGSHSLKVTYSCGSKTPSNTGTLTITN
jgi:penicillin-binding protein 1A